MTHDVIALLHRPPSARTIAKALLTAAPQLRIGQLADGAVLQLFDDDRTLVASIDAASRIAISGEAERLLQVPSPPVPYWWLEIHSPSLQPETRATAAAIALALVGELGGDIWISEPE